MAASSTAWTVSWQRCRYSCWARKSSASEHARSPSPSRGTRRHRLHRRLGAGCDRAPSAAIARQHPGRPRNVEALLALCVAHRPRHALIADATCHARLRDGLRDAGLDTVAHAGMAALDELVAGPDCDTVVAAIVGAAGLSSTLAAACAGKRLLLANKESLVLAGELMIDAAARAKRRNHPDRQRTQRHLPMPAFTRCSGRVRRIVLTASGGPFRGHGREQTDPSHPRAGRWLIPSGRWGRRSRWTRPR